MCIRGGFGDTLLRPSWAPLLVSWVPAGCAVPLGAPGCLLEIQIQIQLHIQMQIHTDTDADADTDTDKDTEATDTYEGIQTQIQIHMHSSVSTFSPFATCKQNPVYGRGHASPPRCWSANAGRRKQLAYTHAGYVGPKKVNGAIVCKYLPSGYGASYSLHTGLPRPCGSD